MHWEEDSRVIYANNKVDAINKKKEIKEDYNFYLHMKRLFLQRNRHKNLINQVNNILNNLDYSYNHVFYPPEIR